MSASQHIPSPSIFYEVSGNSSFKPAGFKPVTDAFVRATGQGMSL